MTKKLLIGNTGFVGSSLARHFEFSHFENSTSPISNETFDEVYCAAPSAIKWKANQEPEQDLLHVHQLVARLKSIEARRFYLFSTVDVYENPSMANENSETVSDGTSNSYGLHRALLEKAVLELFPESLIMRLSGLVGVGLKKNPIFDLGARNNLELLNADSQMQFLPLTNCWDWLESPQAMELTGVVNLTAAPVKLGEVATLAGIRLSHSAPKVSYDISSSRLAESYGPYLVSKDVSMAAIESYLSARN
jgi:nucleoside-diphosphate-sugar epimerase